MRIAIFIDGGYLDKGLNEELNGIKIDYASLPAHLLRHVHPGIELLRTYYYHCYPYQSNPPTPAESEFYSRRLRFYSFLGDLPRFQLRMGRLERRGPDARGEYHYEQKMVDVLLSVDLVQLSATRQLTHAAIVAGDSDFCPAVEAAKSNGLLVCLFHRRRPHRELWKMADERVAIDHKFVGAILRT